MAINRDLLITTSIIDSYKWFMMAPPSWKKKAFNDFFAALSRTSEWKPDKKIQRGIDFENKVYSYAYLTGEPKASPEFLDVLREVKGAVIQKKIKKIEVIGGQSFCLYGKTDAWFPDVIKDVKTTASYKEHKYRTGFQHLMYGHIEQIPKFRYVVAIFNDDEDDKKVQRVEKIDIDMDDFDAVRRSVYATVMEFYDFINNDADLLNAYLNKFCLY